MRCLTLVGLFVIAFVIAVGVVIGLAVLVGSKLPTYGM
jgi:cell division protein FtsW (lipid II flippase)